MQSVHTRDDALQFLKTLQAPKPLLLHAEMVSKVAEQILKCLNLPMESDNASSVLVAAVLHDIGKIKHPNELYDSGHEHEATGYQMLLAYAFPENIAEVCITHSQWEKSHSLETLIVALADKLWKGKRIVELEDQIIKKVADLRQSDFWSMYSHLQACFDSIADGAPERLSRNS